MCESWRLQGCWEGKGVLPPHLPKAYCAHILLPSIQPSSRVHLVNFCSPSQSTHFFKFTSYVLLNLQYKVSQTWWGGVRGRSKSRQKLAEKWNRHSSGLHVAILQRSMQNVKVKITTVVILKMYVSYKINLPPTHCSPIPKKPCFSVSWGTAPYVKQHIYLFPLSV